MLPFKPLFDMYLYVKSGRIKHGSEDSVHKDSFNTPLPLLYTNLSRHTLYNGGPNNFFFWMNHIRITFGIIVV